MTIPGSTRHGREVASSLDNGRPLVALESTLITHGLPAPQNLLTAQEAEQAVRDAGATPATIAVIEGEIRVGLEPQEVERLASMPSILKAARRDLALALQAGSSAGTTVSATLWIARKAGIQVMATGGLGGVHRDAAHTHDVSADLDELARADGCLLVCSGFKSILDMAASVERLETLGVTVMGYRTDHWPAFTTSSSGIPIEQSVDSPQAAAEVVRRHRVLGLPGAIVLARPVPAGQDIDASLMERVIAEALDAAVRQGVAGKAITPFLLDQVRASTDSQSVRVNRQLIADNARLAAEVAVALQE